MRGERLLRRSNIGCWRQGVMGLKRRLRRGKAGTNGQRFFGDSRPIHYLHAYAKPYATLRGLRRVPARAQVSYADAYAGKC